MNKIEFLYNKDKYQGIDSSKALSHYGILGQKWGQRRWQNADGTFNEAGKERYFGPSGTTKKNKEEKIGKKYEGTPYRMNNGKMFHIDYQNPDGSLTKKGEKLLKRAQKHPKLFSTKNIISEDLLHEWEKGMTKDQFKTDNDKEKKEKIKQAETEAKINEIKSSYKIDKNLSGDKITVKEFKDIIDELNNFNKGDFERNHREEYNKVADMGIDALNKAEGEEYDVGNDNTRMWFMWEDQTDGLGEIAYLRSKGYSKDYVKQYLESPLPEEIEEIREKNHYATPFFVRNEFYRGGDNYIDALYDNDSQDQKIGSTNSKEDAKANKEAVKMLADLNDKDYTKRSETLQKLYDDPRFEEQRNNVDKAIKEKFKDDFDELEKTYGGFDEVENEYLALAGLNRALMEDGGKMEDISYMPRLYLYDDLNQGSLTGESIWAYDNGIEDSSERWSKIHDKENSTKDELINSLTSDGSYNSKVLNGLDDATKKDIVDHVYNYKSVPSSYWTLYNAGDTSKSEYDSVKDTTLKEAKEISKKLSSSCGNDASGWALLNKAVNNLNLGGKDYTELTQADWDRINAEINSLKR